MNRTYCSHREPPKRCWLPTSFSTEREDDGRGKLRLLCSPRRIWLEVPPAIADALRQLMVNAWISLVASFHFFESMGSKSEASKTRLPSLLQLRERHDTIVSLAADGDANPWRKVRTELALVDVDLKESDARRWPPTATRADSYQHPSSCSLFLTSMMTPLMPRLILATLARYVRFR